MNRTYPEASRSFSLLTSPVSSAGNNYHRKVPQVCAGRGDASLGFGWDTKE